MKKKKVSLSVVLPVYNAERYIKNNLIKLVKKITSITKNYEIIVVDDGSTDGTQKIISQFNTKANFKKIFIKKNTGKGNAVKLGIKKSLGKIIIYYDCDLPYFEKFNQIYFTLGKKRYDLVMISREKDEYKKIKKNNLFFIRRIFSRLFSYFCNKLIIKNYPDTQAGLKGFQRKHKNKFLKFKTNGFLFDLEILKIAINNKLKIKKIYSTSEVKDYNLKYIYIPKFYLNIFKDFVFIIISNFLKKSS